MIFLSISFTAFKEQKKLKNNGMHFFFKFTITMNFEKVSEITYFVRMFRRLAVSDSM